MAETDVAAEDVPWVDEHAECAVHLDADGGVWRRQLGRLDEGVNDVYNVAGALFGFNCVLGVV